MAFWQNAILKRFDKATVLNSQELKPYREMWVGAIIAASQSLSGTKHYVGLPDDEPPDIDVVRLLDTDFKGKASTKMERLLIEVTRCNFDAGETIVGQIKKKNKPAYAGMRLAVYVHGNDRGTKFQDIFDALQKLKPVFSTVLIVGTVDVAGGLLLTKGYFGVTGVWPNKGQTLVNINNRKAFFRHPEVFRKSRLATGTEWEDLGSLILKPPELKTSK